ncbi:MAG: hypothetical protein ACPGLV_06655, partial [Bacteroidia bacterium]
MKNYLFILLTILPMVLFGQENEAKWALNFANTIYTYKSSYINYYYLDDNEFDQLMNTLEEYEKNLVSQNPNVFKKKN